ncbi:hypothetical protein D3C79_853230 [compost metagenome]
METQKAFFFIEFVFNQSQEFLIARLAIQAHVEQAVQAPDFGMPGFVFQLGDIAARQGNVVGIEQRNRLTQRFGFQNDPQGIGIYGILADQRRDHRTLVRHHLQQRLCLQLAQGFAHGHAADAKQSGQFLLAQGQTGLQATIKDGTAQPFFDHSTSQVWRNLLATQDFAQEFGFSAHAVFA